MVVDILYVCMESKLTKNTHRKTRRQIQDNQPGRACISEVRLARQRVEPNIVEQTVRARGIAQEIHPLDLIGGQVELDELGPVRENHRGAEAGTPDVDEPQGAVGPDALAVGADQVRGRVFVFGEGVPFGVGDRRRAVGRAVPFDDLRALRAVDARVEQENPARRCGAHAVDRCVRRECDFEGWLLLLLLLL